MTADQLKVRTKLYSLAIIDLVEKLPITTASKIVAYQIAKSGTSVGANYRGSMQGKKR